MGWGFFKKKEDSTHKAASLCSVVAGLLGTDDRAKQKDSVLYPYGGLEEPRTKKPLEKLILGDYLEKQRSQRILDVVAEGLADYMIADKAGIFGENRASQSYTFWKCVKGAIGRTGLCSKDRDLAYEIAKDLRSSVEERAGSAPIYRQKGIIDKLVLEYREANRAKGYMHLSRVNTVIEEVWGRYLITEEGRTGMLDKLGAKRRLKRMLDARAAEKGLTDEEIRSSWKTLASNWDAKKADFYKAQERAADIRRTASAQYRPSMTDYLKHLPLEAYSY
ncbi:hypothetical protein KY359_06525 [Candidatus Woesearchaeota archaeon]|nr:hypothetical protein [Candidatus Woesearchaeota archaeon]